MTGKDLYSLYQKGASTEWNWEHLSNAERIRWTMFALALADHNLKAGRGLKIQLTGGTLRRPIFTVICNHMHWSEVHAGFTGEALIKMASSLELTPAQLGALTRVISSGREWPTEAEFYGIQILTPTEGGN